VTTFKQWVANRENARKSTGPQTDEGKRRSRGNALRHGLTAETVITGLEDTEDYQAFEQAILADYDARTAVERELVLRLASLLWRIRRATGIETDLFRIQAEIGRARQLASHQDRQVDLPASGTVSPPGRGMNLAYIGRSGNSKAAHPTDTGAGAGQTRIDETTEVSIDPSRALSHCFLRLINFDKGVFKRLNRYEAALWRQTVQTLFALRNTLHR
jgi:hypothetical protein